MATEFTSLLLHMPECGIPASSADAIQGETPHVVNQYLLASADYAAVRSRPMHCSQLHYMQTAVTQMTGKSTWVPVMNQRNCRRFAVLSCLK